MNGLNKKRLLEILKKRTKGIATPEEQELLNAYFNAFKLQDDYTDTLDEANQEHLRKQLKNKIEVGIGQAEQAQTTNRIWRNKTLFSTAAVLLVLSSTVVILFKPDKPLQLQHATDNAVYAEILPGGNKAILTLSDNSKISLTDIRDGEIISARGIKITKKDGELVYKVTNDSLSGTNEFNKIETPRGGQYQINLPDGTKVFLNALSSLSFPVSFAGLSKREVDLTGEAYFEVAANKAVPFKVTTRSQEILVLGTHFNINAYTDEPASITTLLEGSVRISHNGLVKTLKPNQQAIVKDDILIRPSDENAVAWKNGITSFDNADIKTIMRQVSRWYDVDIEYQGSIPKRQFTGEISRSDDLSVLINILEASNIRFKFNKRTITVIP